MTSGAVQLRRPDVLDFDQLPPSVASISGAAFQRRNCDETVDFDPVTNQLVRRRKESSQWELPTGPNQVQQYSTVLDEKTTVAPNVQRSERGRFEYFLASKSDDERTKAVRSEQRIAETRWLQPAGNDGGSNGGEDDDDAQCWRRGKSTSLRLVTTVESVTTTTSSKAANDWPTYIALLDRTCNRLDHSVQHSKKNLSKNGSLSQRRRPSRSNISGNMSTIFKTDGSATDKEVNLYNNHLIIKSSAFTSHLGFNGRSRPCATIVLPSVNVSTEERYEIQRNVEQPDLIRGVDDAGFHFEEGENWLQEAKNKLKRSTVSLQPFEINGDVSGGPSSRANNGHGRQDSSSSVGRKFVYSSLGLIVMSGGQTSENGQEANSKDELFKLSNGDNKRNEDENQNGCCDTTAADGFGVLRFKYNGSGSDESSDECDTVIENTQYSVVNEPSKEEYKGDVISAGDMGNILEKNKSKSTSNLDDDETIEAPWFQDAKYRKPKFPTREFAKSSLDLKFVEVVASGESSHSIDISGPKLLKELMQDRIAVSSSNEVDSSSAMLRSAAIIEEVEDVDVPQVERDDVTSSSEVTVNGENPRSTLQDPSRTFHFDGSNGHASTLPSMCNENVIIVTPSTNGQSLETRSNVERRSSKDITSRVNDAHRIRLQNIGINSGSKITPAAGWLRRNVKPRKIASSSTELDTSRSESSTTCSSDDGCWELTGLRLSSSPQLQSTCVAAMEFNDGESEDDGRGDSRWPSAVHRKPTKLPFRTFSGTSVDYRHVESISVEGSTKSYATRRVAASGNGKLIKNVDLNGTCKTVDEVQVVVTGDSIDADSWQRIEQEMERKRIRVSDRQHRPDWIREAEDKRRSWTNLSITEMPQRFIEEATALSKASWLEKVKLRSTSVSPAQKDAADYSNASFPRVHLKHVDVNIDESESDRGWSPISSQDDEAAVNCSTAWRYVQLKPVVKSKIKAEDVLLDVGLRTPVQTGTCHLSFENASDTSEDVVGGHGGVSPFPVQDTDMTSQFNVEGYVKRLIDRHRAENRSIQMASTKESCLESEVTNVEPDWLKISNRKSKNSVDWNSLDRLNEHKSPTSSGCASWLDVQLRKTPSSLDLVELPKPKGEQSVRSQQSANRISAVPLKKSVTSVDAATGNNVEAATTTTTRDSKTTTTTNQRRQDNNKIALNIVGTMPTDQQEPLGSLSRSKISTNRDKSPKKVTFDIPKIHRSSPDLLARSSSFDHSAAGDPEWVRIAEQKCRNRINWDNFEKRETSSRFNGKGRWVTQVQLRHVSKPPKYNDDHPTTTTFARPPRPASLGISFSATEDYLRKLRRSETDDDDDGDTTTSNETSHSLPAKYDAPRQVEEQNVSLASFSSLSPLGQISSRSSTPAPKWMQVAEGKRRARMRRSRLDDDETEVRLRSPLSNGHESMGVTRDTSLTTAVTKVAGDMPEVSQANGEDLKQNSLEARSTPSWIQLAELKRSSSIDWTNIDRDVSSSKSSSSEEVHWMQEVRLRSTPASPSKSESQETSVQQRDTSNYDNSIEEIRWPSAGSKGSQTSVDKWQALYQTLFDDLFDQPDSSSTDDVDANRVTLDVSAVDSLKPCSRRRKWASTLDGGHHKRKLAAQRNRHYYSLPEMTSCALPRDGREVEIIQLPSPSTCFDDDDDFCADEDDEELGQKDEQRLSGSKQIGFVAAKSEAKTVEADIEAKPIIFVKLRPTEKKNEDKPIDDEEVARQPTSWLQHVKLRKTASTTTMASSMNEDMTSGGRNRPQRPLLGWRNLSLPSKTSAETSRIRGSPVTMRVSSVSPSVAPRPSVITSHSVRDAIHRDIRQEVARREKTRSVFFAHDEKPDVSPKAGSPLPPNLTAKTESKENDEAFPAKPRWLLELQRKKAEKSKRAPSSIPINIKVPQNSSNDNVTSPSFGSVLDQIKCMGRENLFASLRKTRIEIRTGSPELSTKTESNVSFTSTSCKPGSSGQNVSSSSELLLITCDDIVSSANNGAVTPPVSKTVVADRGSSSPPLKLDDYFECQVTSRNNSNKTRPSHATRSSAVNDMEATLSQVITVTTKWQTTDEGNETFLHEVIVTNNPSDFSKQKVHHGKPREGTGSESKNGAVQSVNEFLKLRRHNTFEVTSPSSSSKFNSPEFELLRTTESDELKSPLLLRTLMSGLTKSKAMYSSDTELNLRSQNSSGLDPATKMVSCKRSLLSLTTLPPPTTVPYYLVTSSPSPPLASTNGDGKGIKKEAGTSGCAPSSSKSTKELQMAGSDFNVHLTNTHTYEFNSGTTKISQEGTEATSINKGGDEADQRWRQQNDGATAEEEKSEDDVSSSAVMSGASDLSVKVNERQEFHITKRSEQHLML